MKEFFTTILYQPIYNLFILIISAIPGHNLGVAIIILTLLIRVLLIPVRNKSMESQAKQQSLQPELKKLQEQHKGDRNAMTAAQMQLYKEKGINPASGCLPSLVQLVVVIVLYRVFFSGLTTSHYELLYPFVHAPETIQKSFLWIADLTKPDPYFILPILAAVAQYLATRVMMKSMPTPEGNDMAAIMSKQMVFLGPVSILLFGLKLPAGLSLYWVVSSLLDWHLQNRFSKRFASQTSLASASTSPTTKTDEPSKTTSSSKVTVSVRKKGEGKGR